MTPEEWPDTETLDAIDRSAIDASPSEVRALVAEVRRLRADVATQAAAVRAHDAAQAVVRAAEHRAAQGLWRRLAAPADTLAQLSQYREEAERWNAQATELEAERDALRAEVEGLRALVAHLTPPEPTPLTDAQRVWLDALLSAHTGPGAVCEHSPASDVTRRELVEAEAAARALGDDARARVASLGLRVYCRYDRERDRVHEVSAILEAAREALGCETWSEVPAEVERLRALLAPR